MSAARSPEGEGTPVSSSPRTLSLRVGVLRLSEQDDIEALFPPVFERILIWADTLQVNGWIRLHGRDVKICTRCVEARPVGDRMAVIDVSGRPAEPVFDPEAAVPHLAGTATAPDGKPGRDGGAGQNGGTVTLCVDVVIGELGLAANGSSGGASERGGNGAQPATVNGVNGKFNKAKWPAKGPHGGGVLRKAGPFNSYIAWATGQAGANARNGGAAGAAGRPGDGGQGGAVTLRWSGKQPPALVTIAEGGAAGVAGRPAEPGPPGTPGAGGLNRMYAYNFTKGGVHEEYALSGKDKWLDAYAREFKIAKAAASGRAGADPGTVPPTPAASGGDSGRVQVEAVAIKAVAAEFDQSFLQLVAALAAQDRVAGDAARTQEREGWLARVGATRKGRPRSSEA